MVASSQKRLESTVPPTVQEDASKVKKVSFNCAKLIARIYEANPLICECGKEIKIIAFAMHSAEIRRILSRIDCPIEIPEFDPPYDLADLDICQLIPVTEDGFPQDETQFQGKGGPDPPFLEIHCDPLHWEYQSDPPHWDD